MSVMAQAIDNPEPIPGWLTVAESARRIGVTTGRIRQLVRAGELGKKELGPRFKLVKKADVARMAAKPAETGRPRGSQNAP